MTTAKILTSPMTTNRTNRGTLGMAALVAGIGLLIMVVAAPFAEMYVLPKLVLPGNAAETTQNIISNKTLFTSAVFGYLITFICDLLVAWALYVFLKPVNENLSRLTAWFRLVYTGIALVALLNLVTILGLLSPSGAFAGSQPDPLSAQVMLSLNTFKSHWNFGLLFFGIHLGLLGYLVLRSAYVPRILGVLLLLAGLGYLLNSLKPFLFPSADLGFVQFTFYGELIFMLWLLVKGSRIKETA